MAATLVFLLSGCRQGKTETGVAAVDSVVVTDTVVAPVKPTKSRTALYLDSLGYLNVAEQDSTIAVDLMYARADNFTGQVLYGDLREAYLHIPMLWRVCSKRSVCYGANIPVTG